MLIYMRWVRSDFAVVSRGPKAEGRMVQVLGCACVLACVPIWREPYSQPIAGLKWGGRLI